MHLWCLFMIKNKILVPAFNFNHLPIPHFFAHKKYKPVFWKYVKKFNHNNHICFHCFVPFSMELSGEKLSEKNYSSIPYVIAYTCIAHKDLIAYDWDLDLIPNTIIDCNVSRKLTYRPPKIFIFINKWNCQDGLSISCKYFNSFKEIFLMPT